MGSGTRINYLICAFLQPHLCAGSEKLFLAGFPALDALKIIRRLLVARLEF